MFDTIYNIDGDTLYKFDGKQLDFNGTPTLTEELMKSNYISVEWNDVRKYTLPAGSYILHDGIKYLLLEPYSPEQKNEAHFVYEPQFQHPIMWLDKLPFYHLQGDTSTFDSATKKASWTYTGNIQTIVGRVIEVINFYAEKYALFSAFFENGWTASIANDIQSTTSTNTIQFNNTSVFASCALIANTFNCEFHFDWKAKVLHFAQPIMLGTEISLIVGTNVTTPNVARAREGYYNAFIIRGGTRNVSQPSISGDNIQVTERLSLNATDYPESIMYTNEDGEVIPKREFFLNDYPLMIKEIDFDDIFPHLTLYIYNPRERRCYLLDDNGNKTEDASDPTRYKTYSKWYIKLAYITGEDEEGLPIWKPFKITEDILIKDKNLTIDFFANVDSTQYPSPLAGRSFEVHYFDKQTTEKMEDDVNPDGFTAEEGDYRIIFEQGDIIIPTTSEQGLVPRGGLTPSKENNICTLVGIAVGDEYNTVAQNELKTAGEKEIRHLRSDLNNYTVDSVADIFDNTESLMAISIGQKVLFNDGQGDNGSTAYIANLRVQKIITNLDFECEKEITLGNAPVKGNTTQLREQVENLIIATSMEGNSSLSQAQFESLLRTLGRQYYLSKTSNDTANGLITFARGINVTGNATVTGDITAQGDVKADDGRFGGDITTTDISCMNIDATGDITADGSVGSTSFTDGFLGSGWRISNTNGNASMTLDTLTVRKTMRIFELLIQKVRATGGEIVVSPAYGKVERVEVASNGDYYLYLEEDTDDGMYGNMFLAGDYVRCQRWDKNNSSVHYYWARVSGVYNNRIAIAGYYFRDVEPEVGDELVLIGNSSNTARQSAITISATESGTPKITVLDGIKGKSVYDSVDQRNYYVPTLEGCTRVVLGDLSGITDTFFGNLNGYGLYSDNVYLRGTFRLANTSDWGGLLGLDDNILTYGGLTQGATGWTNFGATSPTFNPEDGGGWYIDFPKQSDTFTYGGIYTTEFTNRPKSKRKVRVTITYLLTFSGASPSGTLRYGFRDASGNLLTTSSSYAAPQLSRLTKGTQSTISNDLYCPDDAARFFIESTGVFTTGTLCVYKIEVKNILEDNIITTFDVTNGEIRSEVSTVDGRVNTVDGKVSTLTQTVDGIETDVTTIKGDYVKSSQLTQTADDIRSEVSALSNTVDGNTEKISQIEQTANGLTSTVTELSNTVGGNTEKISQIQQTADQISLEVAEKIGEGYELLEYPVEPDASSIWQRRWNKSSGVTFVEQDGGGYYAVFGSSGGYMTTAHLVIPTTQTKVDLYFKGVFVQRPGDPQSGDSRYSITFDLCDNSNNVLSTYTRYCSYYYTPRDNGITVIEALTVMPSTNYLRVRTSEGFTLQEVRIQVPNAMKRTGINIESGQITLTADNTIVDGNLKTHSLETIPDTTGNQSNKAKVKVEGSIMEVFGEGGNMNIRFGVDEDTGYAVLQYYDNDGTMLYDLGPNGLRYISVIEEKWELAKFYIGKPPYNNNNPDYSFHAFSARKVNGIITSSDHASTVELATANNGLWFEGANVTGTKADTNGVVVHKITDSAENLNDTFLTDATTAQAYKNSVKEAYNFSDSDLSGITFTGRVIDGRFVLNKTTYVQRGHLFADGVRTTKYVIWQ